MPTPQEVQYLVQQAQARGYDPRSILGMIHFESSGNPNIWDKATNTHYGIIQFGGPERQKYGVTPGQTGWNGQVDATMNYLQDRGLKPGMPFLDYYSTVNAGRPGLYNAKDGATTVSQKVMSPAMQKSLAWADGLLGGSGQNAQVADMTNSVTPTAGSAANPTTQSMDPEQRLQQNYPLPAAGGDFRQQINQMQANTPPAPPASAPAPATGNLIAGLLGLAAKATAQPQRPAGPDPMQQFNQNAQQFFQQSVAQNQPHPAWGLLGLNQ